jgi:sensor histidine kinase YesM
MQNDSDSGGENRECIGIRNVNRRLKILYGEEGGLTISELPAGRTVARMVIPHVEFCS